MDARLTETELSERWKKSVRTIQSWRKTGAGPQFLDLGHNTIRYRIEDVLAYENRRATGGEIPVRAAKAMKRAAGFFNLISEWKMDAETRQHIVTLRDELRALTAKTVEGE
jgi:hypothetical protein